MFLHIIVALGTILSWSAATASTYHLQYDITYRVHGPGENSFDTYGYWDTFPQYDGSEVMHGTINLTIPSSPSYYPHLNPWDGVIYRYGADDFSISCSFAECGYLGFGWAWLTFDGDPFTGEATFEARDSAGYYNVIRFSLFHGSAGGNLMWDSVGLMTSYWYDILSFRVSGLPRPPTAVPLPPSGVIFSLVLVPLLLGCRRRGPAHRTRESSTSSES